LGVKATGNKYAGLMLALLTSIKKPSSSNQNPLVDSDERMTTTKKDNKLKFRG
jgi:hypothetical protein